MVRQVSFGEVLRDARIRRGMDVQTAARRLRVRADILIAIEECDFPRMPARGYSKSMVGAYARLVGLNPNEITRMYLDDAYAFEVGRVRTNDRSNVRSASSRGDARGRKEMASTGRARNASAQQPRSSRQQPGTRERYSDRPSRQPGSNSATRGRGLYENERPRSSRGGSLPTASTHYTNLVATPKNISQSSKLPFIAASVVVLLVLIIIVVFVFGEKEEVQTDVPTVPISGLTDTSNPTPDTSEPATPVAPTSAQFAYKVADGQSCYIEVYVDGSSAPSEAATVDGPANNTYDVTATLKFVTTNPDGVSITVDGESVKPTDDNADGVYIYTVDFAAILEQWKADNPTASGVEGGTEQDAVAGAEANAVDVAS